MDAARLANRTGWPNGSAPDPAEVALTRDPGPPATSAYLRFASEVDAVSFADWWGLEGADLFALHLARSRAPL